MTVSTGEPETPVEPSVVGLARHLRVALVYGRDARHRVLLSRVALAASLDAVLAVAADDRGSLVEVAQAFRDASPDAVLIACDGRDVRRVAVALEALRLGCAFQRPRPTVHVVADARVGERLRPAANPFVLDVHADATAALVALRALRRSAQPDAALRDELVEDAARALVASTGSSGLVVDVTETTTSCVLARAVGGIESVHLTRAGIGASVDRILAEVGADGVRRWLPWPIDAPALLERIYNRARWPGALPASELALAIEMAVARETIAAAVRAAERASIDVSELRAAPNMLVTGRAAGFPRPAETLLVLVDGLQPTGVVTVWREPDDGIWETRGPRQHFTYSKVMAWVVFDRVVASAPAQLRKGPRGGGRDRDKIADHVLGAEVGYARKLGLRLPQPAIDDGAAIAAMRDTIIECFRKARRGSPAVDKGWPPRYAARRVAWHVLDHAWEIEDRSN